MCGREQQKTADLSFLTIKKSFDIIFKGLKAIHSPQTGIIDWGYVARHFGMMYQQHGGKIVVSFEANEFLASTNPEYPIRITSKNQVRLYYLKGNRSIVGKMLKI